jgi:hypothetical protein
MTNVRTLRSDIFSRPAAQTPSLASADPTSFSTGGGGGGSIPTVENAERINRLEAFASSSVERLARIETKLDHVGTEASQLKWWVLGSMVTVMLTVIATVIATGVGIQQMTVATFVAATQLAKDAAPQAAKPDPATSAQAPAPAKK